MVRLLENLVTVAGALTEVVVGSMVRTSSLRSPLLR
jgi:hypothetical protein